jgi:hypothetical protein
MLYDLSLTKSLEYKKGGEKMNKTQELIQQKLALEIANKTLQLAGVEAELEQARETIAKLESQLDLKGGDE